MQARSVLLVLFPALLTMYILFEVNISPCDCPDDSRVKEFSRPALPDESQAKAPPQKERYSKVSVADARLVTPTKMPEFIPIDR